MKENSIENNSVFFKTCITANSWKLGCKKQAIFELLNAGLFISHQEQINIF